MKSIIVASILLLVSVAAYSVDTNKPDTHNSAWEYRHGPAARADEASCLSCHVERLECISCHEDTKPRNHTMSFPQKTHGLESRWNKTSCQSCHREDFCSSCHESVLPLSHSRANFLDNAHCNTSCQLPRGTWTNTPSKNCLVCHQTRPIRRSGVPHDIK